MNKNSSLNNFTLVIFALLMRETKTRFGTSKLGYLWAVSEPLFHILILSIIFGTFSSKVIPGIEFPVFVMVSISAWLLFNNIMNKSTTAIDSNKGLLVYHNVKPIDTIFSRIVLEIYISFFVFIILLTIGFTVGFNVIINDFLMFFITVLELILFASSIGLFLSILYHYSENSSKLIKIIMRPMYYISAVFYPLSIVPDEYRLFFLYNPIANFMDMLRYYFFGSFDIMYGSHLYVNMISISLLLASVFLFRYLSNDIVRSQ